MLLQYYNCKKWTLLLFPSIFSPEFLLCLPFQSCPLWAFIRTKQIVALCKVRCSIVKDKNENTKQFEFLIKNLFVYLQTIAHFRKGNNGSVFLTT
jgi:hypothetical protein